MWKSWKIIIGVGLALVIIIGLMGMAFRLKQGRINRALAQRDRVEQRNVQATPLEVRLIDDDEDGIPDRGVLETPQRFGRGQRGPAGPEIEVTLVDDDEDGIPDRGVLELPARSERGRDFGPDRGRSFGPGGSRSFGRGPGFGFNRGFSPFMIVGGLVRLACLAGIVALGIFAFTRWRSRSNPTPIGGPVTVPGPEPAASAEPLEVSEAAEAEDEGENGEAAVDEEATSKDE